MQTFSNALRQKVAGALVAIGRYLAGNLSFTVFVLGLLVFCGSLATYSPLLAGVCGGAILMSVAAYPYVGRTHGRTRATPDRQ